MFVLHRSGRLIRYRHVAFWRKILLQNNHHDLSRCVHGQLHTLERAQHGHLLPFMGVSLVLIQVANTGFGKFEASLGCPGLQPQRLLHALTALSTGWGSGASQPVLWAAGLLLALWHIAAQGVCFWVSMLVRTRGAAGR